MSDERIVLVVDDSPSVRETVAFILEMAGYSPRTAVNGKDGLAQIEAFRPRVVLLDAMMPELDGFEVCRRVRSDKSLSNTKIIMLTAMGQRSDAERAREVGADHFFAKPFDHEEVLCILREMFEEPD